jgi:hypothetical protein
MKIPDPPVETWVNVTGYRAASGRLIVHCYGYPTRAEAEKAKRETKKLAHGSERLEVNRVRPLFMDGVHFNVEVTS